MHRIRNRNEDGGGREGGDGMALHELQDKIERLYESNREEVIPYTKEKKWSGGRGGASHIRVMPLHCAAAPPSRRFNVSSPICSISDMDMGGRGRGRRHDDGDERCHHFWSGFARWRSPITSPNFARHLPRSLLAARLLARSLGSIAVVRRGAVAGK